MADNHALKRLVFLSFLTFYKKYVIIFIQNKKRHTQQNIHRKLYIIGSIPIFSTFEKLPSGKAIVYCKCLVYIV